MPPSRTHSPSRAERRPRRPPGTLIADRAPLGMGRGRSFFLPLHRRVRGARRQPAPRAATFCLSRSPSSCCRCCLTAHGARRCATGGRGVSAAGILAVGLLLHPADAGRRAKRFCGRSLLTERDRQRVARLPIRSSARAAYLGCFIFVPGGMAVLWLTGTTVTPTASDARAHRRIGSFGMLPWIQTYAARHRAARRSTIARWRFAPSTGDGEEHQHRVQHLPSGHAVASLAVALAVSEACRRRRSRCSWGRR